MAAGRSNGGDVPGALGAGDPLLGLDPLAEEAKEREGDPLAPWLDALDRVARTPDARPAPRPPSAEELAAAVAPGPDAREDRPLAPPEPLAPRAVPRVAEADVLPELRRMADLLGEDPVRRLSAFAASLEGWDRFGLSKAGLARSFPFFYALYRVWFRVRSTGHELLPASGPAVLVANHGGLLPFDGAMAVLDVLLHTDPPRLPRAIVERWAGTLPFVNVFYARVGQVIGTKDNFERLLRDGEAVLVFPEGVEGIRKRVTQRYRLQRFRVGFVEHALRARAPIVPMAILGSDDQAPILYDLKPLARLLGLPTAPITPTFPWLGPLGLLPYPVRYRIVYGAPLRFHERFGPDAAEDASLVRALANQVRRQVQALIDKSR
jgi:1-acyl-sn-glycerol-3-phosphate acyltransferase